MPYNRKSKANLQPGVHKAHLKKGGKKKRWFLTLKEIDFCSFMAQTGNARASARYSEIKEGSIGELLKRPLIVETVKKFSKDYAAKTTERDAQRREETKELTHREFMYRLPRMKTHRFRGDETIQKMLKTGFESTGEIQPARITAQANAGAASSSSFNLYAKRLYLPEWRREVIKKLQHDDGSSGNTEVPAGQ